MLESLPRRALFQFEIPIPYLERSPRIDGSIDAWPKRCLAPALVELEDQHPFADVYWAWNDAGFYVAFDVPGRSALPHCDPETWWKHDGLRLCISTREAREIKRATRYCHFFYFLPLGGGADRKQPVVGTHRMNRAKEPPPTVDATLIRVAANVTRRGYCLEAAIPAACLYGWSPTEHPRIGVFYKVKDGQLGAQHLSADDELGWNVDPSTWATGVLRRGS